MLVMLVGAQNVDQFTAAQQTAVDGVLGLWSAWPGD